MAYRHKPEEAQMIKLFDWIYMMENQDPRFKLIFHVPNESKSSIQRRMSMKRAGVRSGVPDILGLVCSHNGSFMGFALEMKIKGNKPSENQLSFIDALNKTGTIKAKVVWSADEAMEFIQDYLGIN